MVMVLPVGMPPKRLRLPLPLVQLPLPLLRMLFGVDRLQG